MFEVHIAERWGPDGLENTTKLVEFSNSELAWEYVGQYYADHGTQDFLLVRHPRLDYSRGYPSVWMSDPDWICELFRELNEYK